ncbi:MAG: hypothetical protein IJW65_01555 [Clostridia bacterium]|nr:hypothetical protein [Clostridia bacterium]
MQKTRHRKNKAVNFLLPMLILFIFVLLLLSPEVSFEYMKSSLKLCVQSLIPSLFPFMVISDILVSGNFGGIVKTLLSRAAGAVFGTSREGSFAVVLGLLCGFPIGAKSALKLYSENRISRAELCHVMSFCNIPSPAFTCGTVGVMFGDRRLGIILFFSLLVSSLVMGIAGRFIYKYDKKSGASDSCSADALAVFTSSVMSSALVVLYVCAYVVFFSVLIGYSRHLCGLLGAPDTIPLILSGLLEISNGMSCAAGANAPLLAAFFAGFSGLSVIFQIISLDKNGYIRKKAFVFQKLLQGLICTVITFFALKIFPVSTSPSAQTMTNISFESYGLYICILFFICAALPVLATVGQKKKL